jgi:hypothetical protein
VTVNSSSCAPNTTYNAIVRLTPDYTFVGGDSVDTPITVNVGDVMVVTPSPLDLGNSIATDANPPASQTLTLSASSNALLAYNYSVFICTEPVAGPPAYAGSGLTTGVCTAAGSSIADSAFSGAQPAASATGWLRSTVGPGSASLASPTTLTVAVDPTVWASLASSATGAAYNGRIIVKATGGGAVNNSAVAVNVTFKQYTQPIVARNAAGTSPLSSLTFNGVEGGGTVPNQAFTVNVNTGWTAGANLDFSLDVQTDALWAYQGSPYPADLASPSPGATGGASSPVSWLKVSIPNTAAPCSPPNPAGRVNSNTVALPTTPGCGAFRLCGYYQTGCWDVHWKDPHTAQQHGGQLFLGHESGNHPGHVCSGPTAEYRAHACRSAVVHICETQRNTEPVDECHGDGKGRFHPIHALSDVTGWRKLHLAGRQWRHGHGDDLG